MSEDTVFYAPRLWIQPEEGWIAWAIRTAKELGGESLNEPAPDTVSGRLIAASAPAYAQGLALPRALIGALETEMLQGEWGPEIGALAAELSRAETPDECLAVAEAAEVLGKQAERLMVAANAKATRLAFEAGQLLSLTPWQTPERYVTFSPVLRFAGEKYTVGSNGSQSFTAPDHAQALTKARMWYLRKREEEIEAAKEHARSVAPLYADLLAALLRRDKALRAQDQVLAWENGAHGLYGVDGGAWLYLMETTPEVTARMAVMAYRERFGKDAPPLALDQLRGHGPDLLGLDGWQVDGGSFHWQSGSVEGGVIQVQGKDLARVAWSLETAPRRVVLMGLDKKRIVDSVVPDGLEISDVVAWAVFRAIQTARRKQEM